MAATSFTPHWAMHPWVKPRGPSSWIFYIVSKFDDRHHHRTLAAARVTSKLTHPDGGIHGIDVVIICRRILTIFSDPTNRVAVESEVSLAHDFYNDADRANTHLSLTELPAGKSEPVYWYGAPPPPPPENWGLHEFPFISSCLLLGASYALPGRGTGSAIPMPLDTVYRDDNTEYGMVVVDITDLDNIRYGIVGFTVNTMVWVDRHPDEQLGQFGEGGSRLVPGEDRERQPLSVVQYMEKFGYEDPNSIVRVVDDVALVDTAAMNRKSTTSHNYPP
jgi:hypothetical protein